MEINKSYHSEKYEQKKDLQYFLKGIKNGNRFILSEAITLIESTNLEKRNLALKILKELPVLTHSTIRIGITGSPGVGKSTFLDTLGKMLTALGKKIAILAIDPSSRLTKGSILGDKTRMEQLSKDPNAFIRPTASGTLLGGVSAATREAVDLCEAAGFDVIFIETVGVGQSETEIVNLVDIFCLMILPGAGDEIQGIKRGITEMANLVIVNKADGDRKLQALETSKQYENAFKLLPSRLPGWKTKVLTCSGLTGDGLSDVWNNINEVINHAHKTSFFHHQRKKQREIWFDEISRNMIIQYYLEKQSSADYIVTLRSSVLKGELTFYEALLTLSDELKK